jgi:hypothetical protein
VDLPTIISPGEEWCKGIMAKGIKAKVKSKKAKVKRCRRAFEL